MVENPVPTSPLARFAAPSLAAPSLANGPTGVVMAERPFTGKLVLRGDAADPAFLAAARNALGFDLPLAANTATGEGPSATLWLGPNEWLVTTAPSGEMSLAVGLKVALVGLHAALTDISDARTQIRLSGPNARDVLAKGCPIDLHPRVFGPGRVAQSVIARAGALIHQTDDVPTYDIYVLASFAAYLCNWLTDSAAEYGLVIGP
jgi:sarcosine oxidase subunit gamma